MKTLIFVLLSWPVATFAQLTPVYSTDSKEWVYKAYVANFSGNNNVEIGLGVGNFDKAQLVFIDANSKQELAKIPAPVSNPQDRHLCDTDGNGVYELLHVTPGIEGPGPHWDKVGFTLYEIKDNILTEEANTEFHGVWADIGDLNGDGNDEIVLSTMPEGGTEFSGDGPWDIIVLSREGTGFRRIANVTLPTTHMITSVADLDGDGKAELIILRSGYFSRDSVTNEQIPHLSVYSYEDESTLRLVDEVQIPMERKGNLGLLWIQPLEQNRHRIVIPIPVPYVPGTEDSAIDRYQGFQLEGGQLSAELEPLSFKWETYLSAPWKLDLFTTVETSGDLPPDSFQLVNRRQLFLNGGLPPALPKRR
ncbi:MAG: VCBS repeat-containing protein [Gemmatimonadota bacterium]|nr:VCBS repeat-containing protein [Gemmatimonadota bacterium]